MKLRSKTNLKKLSKSALRRQQKIKRRERIKIRENNRLVVPNKENNKILAFIKHLK
jgi:hypothetical protein